MKISKVLLTKVFLIALGVFGANSIVSDASATEFANSSELKNIKLKDGIQLARCDYDSIADKVNLNNLRNALDSY